MSSINFFSSFYIKTHPLRAIIFDLYGTLIHLPEDTKPYKRLWDHYGIKDYERVKHAALIQEANHLSDHSALASIYKGNYHPSLKDLEYESFLQMVMGSEISKAKLFDEVPEALNKLREKNPGIKIGLISNLASPYRQPFYNLNLDRWIEKPIFSCGVGLKKPDPLIYLTACTELGVEPDNCLMIGDSLVCDVEGPRKVGIRTVLLDRSKKDNLISLLRQFDL